MRSLRSLVLGGLLLLGGVFVVQACGKQSEGMRCELLNGNDDCESSLICSTKCGFSICCPSTGGSTAECQEKCSTIGNDAAVAETSADAPAEVAADTGAPETTADTGAADAGDETPADAADAD
jgi:hypothetical protein